jgi:hypothetical protein
MSGDSQEKLPIKEGRSKNSVPVRNLRINELY